jgi:predicted Rossmann fold flavoprotein
MFPVLERDLGVRIIPPRPALCPVEVTDFPYADLAGISFEKAEIRKVPASRQAGPAKGMRTVSEGALLLTHRGYSGPAALDFSGSLHPGDVIEVNYIAPVRYEEALEILKTKSTGSRSELSTIVSEAFGLPKRFARRLTGLSGPSLREAAARLTRDRLTVQSAGDLSEAMVTAGGASLDEMDLRTMELKKHPGVFLIGEALDIDGDTGGYNLQFAYSSARAAADTIADKEI